MSETTFVAIQYIGSAAIRNDNIVHGSGRVWKGRFSSVRIPLAEAGKYLQHSLEFRLLTPLFLLSPEAEALSADEQVYAMLSITSNLEKHAAEELLVGVQARLKELEDFGGTAEVSVEDRPRFNERRLKIAQVIAAMDADNPEHYTDTGRPRVSVVNKLCELRDVSAAEIAEVMRQMKATRTAKG